MHSDLETADERWFLEVEDVPETLLHDVIIELLKLVLKQRFRGENVLVARNLACRWDPKDHRIGVDPDLIVVSPAPPEGEALKALHVWEGEHSPPTLAIEVVSATNAEKDYVDGPARMSRLGAEELWLFDPEGHGSSGKDGPYTLQIWRRGHGPNLEREYAGDGPAYSPALKAWVVTTDDGHRLRISEDAEGFQLWPTSAEMVGEQVEAAKDEAEAAKRQAEAAKRQTEAARAQAKLAEDRARAAEAELDRLRTLLDHQEE